MTTPTSVTCALDVASYPRSVQNSHCASGPSENILPGRSQPNGEEEWLRRALGRSGSGTREEGSGTREEGSGTGEVGEPRWEDDRSTRYASCQGGM